MPYTSIPLYDIVRFYLDKYPNHRTIKRDVTLEEAQAHCSLESTHGEGWFDGFRKNGNTRFGEPYKNARHGFNGTKRRKKSRTGTIHQDGIKLPNLKLGMKL